MQWRSSAVCTAAKLFQIHISESLKHRFQFNNSTVAHFNKKKTKGSDSRNGASWRLR